MAVTFTKKVGKLCCLNALIQSFLSSQCDPTQKAPEFILKMMQRELNYNKSLKEFDWVYLKLCGNNALETEYRLQDRDITSLCASLLNVPIINSLDLRFNRITDDGAITLANYLKNDRCLKELNLTGNDIMERGAREIGQSLKINHTLERLKLTGNPIGREGGIALAQGLQLNAAITQLDVGECDLEISSAIAFATVLRTNKTIDYFSMDRLILFTRQEEQTIHICEMLRMNTNLKELHLSRCDMRDYGAERVVEALEENKTLQVLDLSSNRIARDGGSALARGLSNRCSLTILDLSCNRIQCEGAVAIAKALKEDNNRLVVLHLTYNEIREKGLCTLADALLYNDSLHYIYLWGNEINEKAAAAWAHLQTIGRIRQNATDLKPFTVDGTVRMALLRKSDEHCDYRYDIPSWHGQVPEGRSIALF
ncbi:Leucine-rich repeat-containing protein 34 [Taenia crassiceps]|uniref:Leucine-rich repeat-containing protein 34 n=1 Tax=Taenia crassiceps TaxID=6207 RepID=A0ABR4Q5G1_9CEST